MLIYVCVLQGNFWLDSASQFQSFDEIKPIIKHAYGSESAAEAILQAYHLTPKTDIQALHLGLIELTTDIKFGLPVHAARPSLSSSDNTPEQHPSIIQSYRIQYTSPFPGPLQAMAHHCIDMLYIFDAFHEHLAKTSERSNQDLVLAMQTHWIDFIWDGCKPETSGCGIKEDEMTVYGRDRRAVVRNMREDPECLEREGRFELLARDPEGTRRLWEMLVGLIPRS